MNFANLPKGKSEDQVEDFLNDLLLERNLHTHLGHPIIEAREPGGLLGGRAVGCDWLVKKETHAVLSRLFDHFCTDDGFEHGVVQGCALS